MSAYRIRQTFIGQLERGTDLHTGITEFARKNSITLGRVTGLGAVQKATLAYYDQTLMKYCEIRFAEPMEIVNLFGNVSLKDGKPFLHAHVVLSDDKGNARGGHLLPGGSPVFACEIIVEVFEGSELVRGFDEQTGLTLWPRDKTL